MPNRVGVTVEVEGDGAVEIRAVDLDSDGLEAAEYVGWDRPKEV